MVGKKKIPTTDQLLTRKTFGPKKEPVWVTLENEMRSNTDKKPYNEKVGKWLKFLKDLKHFYHRKRINHRKKMLKEIGPPWYYEFSALQRSVLYKIKEHMHSDIKLGIPTSTRKSIYELGITLKFSNDMLMEAIIKSCEDTGLFFWHLYKMYYKVPPSELVNKYDMNAKLMMSALVFVDLEECKHEINKATARIKPPPPKPPKKKITCIQPDVKYGEYLQRIYVPCTSPHPKNIMKSSKPLPLAKKIKLRSEESLEVLAGTNNWLEQRLQRNIQSKPVERVCNYKFWEAPTSLRITNPKMAAYVKALKMFKQKAKTSYLKYKLPFDNIQVLIKTVAYINGHPVYCLETYTTVQSEYIPHNGGCVVSLGEYVTNILGYYKYPNVRPQQCPSSCSCNVLWDSTVLKYLNATQCECGHRYDITQSKEKAKAKYFNKPTNILPHWFDYAQIYQFDPWNDFVRKEFIDALDSNLITPSTSGTTVSLAKIKKKQLLSSLLAELSNTPLMIPHLPKANLLKNLQELVRKRIKGKLKDKKQKKMLLKSKRRWLQLKHLDLTAKAYMIPFSKKERAKFDFSRRPMLGKLFDILYKSFEQRNRQKMLEHSQMLWATMFHEAYPNKRFLDIFFTYMPSRAKDVYVFEPYCSQNTPKHVAKTCPLLL